MTLIDHFEELRKRIFIALGAWIVGAGVGFAFLGPLLDWLDDPLPPGTEIVTTQLLEPFIVSMQIAAFSGLVLASPIILGQVWGFIAPGLYSEERRWAVPFIFFSVLAFGSGVVFARYVILPYALPIILGFLPVGEVTTLLSIGDYISKFILYMAVFGFLFEMPILSFLLARLGILYANMLTQYRRHAIVVGTLVAALITPTIDPFNLALVALPLVILYEISIIVVRFSQRKVEHGREDSELTQAN